MVVANGEEVLLPNQLEAVCADDWVVSGADPFPEGGFGKSIDTGIPDTCAATSATGGVSFLVSSPHLTERLGS